MLLTMRMPRCTYTSQSVVAVHAQANVDVASGLKVQGETHFLARANPE